MADEFQKFLARYPIKKVAKDTILVFQGETPRAAYIVKSGVIKTYNLSVAGDEKPVDFYSKDDVFPVPWIFKRAPNAYFYYEAFTNCELFSVPRDDYLSFIQRHPDFMYETLQRFINGYLGNNMRLNALQHSKASDKLVYTLHYLTLSHGRQVAPKHFEIDLKLTHQDFANLTGLTRETAATELNKLKNLGVISYGKHTPYQVFMDKLQRVINDQFISDVQMSSAASPDSPLKGLVI